MVHDIAASSAIGAKIRVPAQQQHVNSSIVRLIQNPQLNQAIKFWVTFVAIGFYEGGVIVSVMKKLDFSV